MSGSLASIVVLVLGGLSLSDIARAAPPVLLSVGHENRHPTATFSMPGADDATIYFASKPDRATDGRFLEENVKHIDFLTADEMQGGRWLDSSQIDPGVYYVMLRATDFDCFQNPNCADGFSNVATLTLPKPSSRYRGSVSSVFRYSGVMYLKLAVNPLGERLPYRLCWRLETKRRVCVAGAVEGSSWNSAADDELRIRMRGMAKRTTFTWYVGSRRVASRTLNTTRR